MRIHYLQHESFEDPGYILDWAQTHGHSLSATHLYAGETPPRRYEMDWLIIMGGSMNIYEVDKFPWLAMEKNFIGECIERGVKCLGICLGAQLLADVLGGSVTRNPLKEIGWFPVQRTQVAAASPFFAHLPDEFDVMHWHGDTFSIPPGCKHLASSVGCANQAFSYMDHVLALQYHHEFTLSRLDDILRECADELVEGPFVQSPEIIRAHAESKINGSHAMLSGILDAMEKL